MDGGSIIPLITAASTLIGAGSSLIGMTKKTKTPKIDQPAVSAPAKMPTMEDDSVRAAARAELLRRKGSHGRESTILTDEKLGG